MIPQFPNFKKLEFSDREHIEKIVKDFIPYADYNFLNLWSWNITENVQLSILNNNLVIRFTEYVTQVPFYSFLGSKRILETSKKLIKFSKSQGLKGKLKLIAEDIAIELKKDESLKIQEDRDSFDYLLSVEILKNYPGSKLSNKRNYVRRFVKEQQNYKVQKIDISTEETKKEINLLFDKWAERHKDFKTEYEKIALNRFMDCAKLFKIFTVGVYIDNQLEAFWSHQFIEHSCTVSHFEKANALNCDGLYPFLMQETAKLLSEEGIFFINFEQDLGIKNLREGKLGYLPYGFLKKFTIMVEN